MIFRFQCPALATIAGRIVPKDQGIVAYIVERPSSRLPGDQILAVQNDPIIANRTIYVLTDRGRLIALR